MFATKYGIWQGFKAAREITHSVNWAGRVKIEAHGQENIPKEKGFIFFPVLHHTFCFRHKKEGSKTILLNRLP